MSKLLIAVAVALMLLIVLVSLRHKPKIAEPKGTRASSDQRPDDLVRRLMNSKKEGAFLIVGVKGSDDFLQMTGDSTGVQLDFPLITDRQQSLESKIRKAVADLNLTVTENRGSDGSRFIDIDVVGEPAQISAVCRALMEQVFAASEASLRFEHDGLT